MGSVWLTRVQFFSLAETATKPSCARNLSKNHVWTRGKGSRRTHRTKKWTPHLTLCFPPPDCRGAQAERVGRCWCLLATKNHSKNQRQKGGRGFQLQEGRGMWDRWPKFWFCSARFRATRCCCCRSPKKPQNHRRLVERFRGARDGDELTYLICVSCTPPPPPPPLRILAARGDDLNKKKTQRNPGSTAVDRKWYCTGGNTHLGMISTSTPRRFPAACPDAHGQNRRWVREQMEEREKT